MLVLSVLICSVAASLFFSLCISSKKKSNISFPNENTLSQERTIEANQASFLREPDTQYELPQEDIPKYKLEDANQASHTHATPAIASEEYKPRKWLIFFAFLSLWATFLAYPISLSLLDNPVLIVLNIAITASVVVGVFLVAKKNLKKVNHMPVVLPLSLSLVLTFSMLILTDGKINFLPPFAVFEFGWLGLLFMTGWIVPLVNYLIIERPRFSPIQKTDRSDELVLSKNPIVSYYQIWKIEREFKKAELQFKYDYALAQKNGTEPPKPPYYKLDDALKNYKRMFWVARIALLLIGGLGLVAYITEDGRKKLMSEVANAAHVKSCETADGIIRRWALGC